MSVIVYLTKRKGVMRRISKLVKWVFMVGGPFIVGHLTVNMNKDVVIFYLAVAVVILAILVVILAILLKKKRN